VPYKRRGGKEGIFDVQRVDQLLLSRLQGGGERIPAGKFVIGVETSTKGKCTLSKEVLKQEKRNWRP